ncbi:PREDICTED: leucine-rich repeat-containing protein 14-like [Ficedula albicollis]|uniref:Leucine-rich repeat-containing protein 14 n=1 Tax=Ficedula albicollis TaxID=59894 RepID=U3KG54_FICAL|nr:PREDICTED: leucine-rich repeat-containing protein 14-like [Ficedula albicollis]
MDSLVFLCARRVVAQRPLPTLPSHLYPVLFQVAFLDGRPLVLRDLVATWPFPELNLWRLLGRRKLLRDHSCTDCVQAVIQGVVDQLRQEPDERSRHSSLRVLDMTRLSHSVSGCTPTGLTIWFSQNALAKACMEVSKHQPESQRRGSKWPKGCSGAATAAAAPQPPGVDVHTDLRVNEMSYEILCNTLQAGAASPLRLKCRELQAGHVSASEIVTLLESLDPCCLQMVELWNTWGLTWLLVILPHLSRFPELRSLKLKYIDVDMQHLTPESTMRIRSVARQLGMLPGLQELSLGFSELSGNLQQILCDLQTPLESLELGYCFLVPADLTFLSQSIHAPALKMLDLSGNNISQGLLEPLRLLLEETSASLLYLDLEHCHVADSHLAALLPTLLRCSRLRFLRLFGNPLSTAAIKDLLQRTLELPDLHLVEHPYPMDCYKPVLPDSGWDFVLDEELLAVTTAEISQLLENSGRTDLIFTYHFFGYRDTDYFF